MKLPKLYPPEIPKEIDILIQGIVDDMWKACVLPMKQLTKEEARNLYPSISDDSTIHVIGKI